MADGQVKSFDEFGPFNQVWPLNQVNWAKFFFPISGDGVAPGYLNEMEIYANSTGMVVYVSTGACYVHGHRAAVNDPKFLRLADADSELSRIDRIVARATYGDEGESKIDMVVLQGEPAAEPVEPELTQIAGDVWEVPLASVMVAPGAVTIGAMDVNDQREKAAASENDYWSRIAFG